MAPPRRASSIAAIGLTGAPAAPTEVERAAVPERERPTVPEQERPTVRPSRRSRGATGHRGDGATARRRPADDGTSVKYTVLFTRADAFAADDLMTTLGRARGRKVDKSQVVRELLRMAAADPALRDRLLDRLGED